MTNNTRGLAFAVALVWAASPLRSDAQPLKNGQYAPYAPLIGTWSITAEKGGPEVAIQRFTWGPNQSYIWYASSLIQDAAEVPHFEGMLMWDGVQKNLAMLLAVDLQTGRGAEKGTVSVETDGTIVREISAIYSEGTAPLGEAMLGPAGGTRHFRQTYRVLSADKVLTTVMRETAKGWVATFPGSDHLLMTRRAPK